MAARTVIKERLEFHRKRYDLLQEAYIALVEGGVKSYMVEDRQLTRLDLQKLSDEIKDVEKTIDELEAMLSGGSARKAVGIIPRDW